MSKSNDHNTIFFTQYGLVNLPAIFEMREHIRHDDWRMKEGEGKTEGGRDEGERGKEGQRVRGTKERAEKEGQRVGGTKEREERKDRG